VGSESFDDHKFEAAMTSIEHLRAFAKPLGVRILLENIPNELFTPERLVELIHAMHFDDVGVCFDVGHAHLMTDVPQAFETLKDYIHSTHVHDNKKDRDSHLWPGDGSIDWKQAVDLLRSARHTPPLLLEIEEDEAVNPADKIKGAFEKLGV
jgi:sugar phosphate isomerase/epimerase